METTCLQTTLATTCSLELAKHPLEVLEPLETLEEQQHPWDVLDNDNPIILVNNMPLRNRLERLSISIKNPAAKFDDP